MKLTYRHTRLACYIGYITQAIIVNLAPLLFTVFRDSYNISFEALGRLTLINFFTQMIVDILAVKYIDRIGYRKALLLAGIFSASGLVMFGVLPAALPAPYIWITFATVIFAMGSGIIEVLVSPIVDRLPSETKEANMTLLHAFYCWGWIGVILLTTLMLRLFTPAYWFFIPLLWALIPFCNIFFFWRVPLPEMPRGEEGLSLKGLFSKKIFILALFLMLCAGAAEAAMAQWASLFTEEALGISKVTGDLLGPGLFALTMGLGRTVYGVFGKKIKMRSALIASAVLCIACYLAAALSGSALVSLLGCIFCGLSISLMWPGMLGLCSVRIPLGGTAMFALLAMGGDIGCAVGPWITGAVADLVPKLGLRGGLLAAVIFPLGMLIGAIAFGKGSRDSRRGSAPDPGQGSTLDPQAPFEEGA